MGSRADLSRAKATFEVLKDNVSVLEQMLAAL